MVDSPTEFTEDGTYWLYVEDVVDGSRIQRERYFSKHDVARPEDVSVADLPPAESEAVRELDREALDEERTVGKWHVPGSAESIERLWPGVVDDVTEQVIWGAKVMTATGWEEHPGDDYMIIVYTPNYFEKHDVDRVREHLREAYGLTETLYYKPDLYSVKGIQPETAGEWGLSMPARYRA